MNTTIQDKMVVGISYTLHDDEGSLIEERTPEDPLLYIQGLEHVIPHIEEALVGQAGGFQAELVVKPEDYYGEYEEDLVAEIDRKEFPTDVEMKVGMEFEIEGPDGEPLVAEIVDVSPESITLDGNHPLAGVELHFRLKVESVRPATPEELEHGHVHGGAEHYH